MSINRTKLVCTYNNYWPSTGTDPWGLAMNVVIAIIFCSKPSNGTDDCRDSSEFANRVLLGQVAFEAEGPRVTF